jgi:hypothetical protein
MKEKRIIAIVLQGWSLASNPTQAKSLRQAGNGNQITRIGISRQWVHNMTQNLVHKGFGDQNYYMFYDEFRRSTHFYTGYRNSLSIWDR